MGFFVMVFSMLLGIVLIAMGLINRKKKGLWMLAIVIGILCVCAAVWLGLPK